MPSASIEDVTDAILEALSHFNHGTAMRPQHFEAGSTHIMHNSVGNREDYGHAAMYVLYSGYEQQLVNWWREVEPNGWVLARQYKPIIGCYEMNVQFTGANGRLFNYHVAVN